MPTQRDLEAGVRSDGSIDVGGLHPIVARALLEGDRLRRLGVREQPAKSNRGPNVDRILIGYHKDRPSLVCLRRYLGDDSRPCEHCKGKPAPTPSCAGAPWCARFARWIYEVAVEQLGEPRIFDGAGDLAGAHKWLDFGKARGRLVKRAADIVPGDVCVTITGELRHVAIATSRPNAKGFVQTIEGNTRDEVGLRERSITIFGGSGGIVRVVT